MILLSGFSTESLYLILGIVTVTALILSLIFYAVIMWLLTYFFPEEVERLMADRKKKIILRLSVISVSWLLVYVFFY